MTTIIAADDVARLGTHQPDLARALRTARRVEIFTGAGMSKDSGLDTFRDAQTGIWENLNPQDMASVDSWERDPEPMLAWYLWRAVLCRRAQPNYGHLAITRWQRALEGTTLADADAASDTAGDIADNHPGTLHVTTQNVDDLHERAGTSNIHHLHGSLFSYRCSVCGEPAHMPALPETQLERVKPPACTLCGGAVRPGVVWFGENLPSIEWNAAEASMNTCDLVVIIGTSGVVWPAAGLPQIAARRGVPIVEVSPMRTDLTPLATWSLRTTAALGVPTLVDAVTQPNA